jgi:hypothetical protein
MNKQRYLLAIETMILGAIVSSCQSDASINRRKMDMSRRPAISPIYYREGQTEQKVSFIILNTPFSWHLMILPDGSGRWGYGDGDGESFPAGSFVFQEVIQRLLETAVPFQQNSKDYCAFSIGLAGKRYTVSKSVPSSTARPLFEKARGAIKLFPDSQALDEMWQTVPPFGN